jgi:hypothetical protein
MVLVVTNIMEKTTKIAKVNWIGNEYGASDGGSVVMGEIHNLNTSTKRSSCLVYRIEIFARVKQGELTPIFVLDRMCVENLAYSKN